MLNFTADNKKKPQTKANRTNTRASNNRQRDKPTPTGSGSENPRNRQLPRQSIMNEDEISREIFKQPLKIFRIYNAGNYERENLVY